MTQQPQMDGLIRQALSGRFEIEDSKLAGFIEHVEWVLSNSGDDFGSFQEFEEYGEYVGSFDPNDFWVRFVKALNRLVERITVSPRELWVLGGSYPPDGPLEGLGQIQERFFFLEILHFFSNVETYFREEFEWWYQKGVNVPRTLDMLIDFHWFPLANFEQIKFRIESAGSNSEMLAQAIAEKCQLEQDLVEALFVGDASSEQYLKSLIRQCQLEIDSLERILEVVGSTKQFESKRKSKLAGLTTDQTGLFFHYLFYHFGLELNATEKAELINILTGHDQQNLRAFFSNVNKPYHDKPRMYKENINEVKKIFSSLKKLKGRKDIIDLIDRETDEKM